jgi:hypothetical protein
MFLAQNSRERFNRHTRECVYRLMVWIAAPKPRAIACRGIWKSVG